MDTCTLCGGSEFYIESGYYYCQECQTQQENRREEAIDYIADPLIHIRKKKIRRINKSSINSADRHGFGWTSWEAYNFILLGWTNELIELGASTEIKITVLQLWTTYLNKLEVAFRSCTKKLLPRLPIGYREKDADILYGNINARGKTKKRKRTHSSLAAATTTGINTNASEGESDNFSDLSAGRRASSMTKRALIDLEYKNYLDTTGSDTDTVAAAAAVSSTNQSLFSMQSDIQQSGKKKIIQLNFNKYAREKMKKRIKKFSKKNIRNEANKFRGNNDPMKVNKKFMKHLGLLEIQAILNLALRINDENIYLSDMLRFQYEGHMSTRHLEHFFPDDEPIPEDFIGIYLGNSYKHLHSRSFEMARFLEAYEIPEPNLVALIERYCTELQLPQGIVLYAERIIALSPPNLTVRKRNKNLPLYEAKAISIILIVMKILFGLDGVTEYEISRVVDKINTAASRGYSALLTNQNSVNAAEDALWWLENDEFLNCGYGCSPNGQNIVETDASIMNGTTKQCGSVVGLKDVEHPITVARYIMENYSNKIYTNELMKKMTNIPKFSMGPGNMDPIFQHENEMKNFSCGCISWDGQNLVVGSTGGGERGKPKGAVSDAGIIGTGLFASDEIACCVTGPSTAMIELTLASAIVEDTIEFESCPQKTLKQHIDNIEKQFNEASGGIVLHTNGCIGVYSTAPYMPYAVIKNHLIVYGWKIDEEEERHFKKYCDEGEKDIFQCDSDKLWIAEGRNTMECKLFNFIEWQRYIECRRTVVMSQHYPTKFRYDPASPCQNINVFVNYIKKFYKPGQFVDKSIIIQEFTNIINQNMEKLGENLPDIIEEGKTFEPSLTPMHSYLQELLRDSKMDLPNILRQNFTNTKIGYLTNPQLYKNLAKECEISLVIIDSSAHFLHRIIPPHGNDKRLSDEIDIEERNELTQLSERQKDIVRSDDPLEYLHRKHTGKISIDNKKCKVYKRIHQTEEQIDEDDYNDFSFDQVRDDGKLNVFDMYEESSNSDNNDYDNVKSLRSFRDENMLLSDYEKQSMKVKLKNHWHIDNEDIKIGNFQWQMKRYLASKEQKEIYENCECVVCKTYVSPFAELDIEDKNNEENYYFATTGNDDDDDLTIVGEISKEDNFNDFENDGISILSEKIRKKNQTNTIKKCENEITFSPYKDYWMHRINGELRKQKLNWHLLERDLPVNFRWLLYEFAKVIEIEPSLLYKEMAYMEQYYSDCLVKNYNVERAKNFYHALYHRDIRFTQAIRYKWNNITAAEEREEKLAKNPKLFSSWTRLRSKTKKKI